MRNFNHSFRILVASMLWALAVSAPTVIHAQRDPPSGRELSQRVHLPLRIQPHWFGQDAWMWYRNELPQKELQYILVNTKESKRDVAFDLQRLADALTAAGAKNVDSKRLALDGLAFSEDATQMEFSFSGKLWSADRSSCKVEAIDKRILARDATDNSLERQSGIVSRGSGPETSIVILNHLQQAVELFWIDPAGRKRSYGRVAPGEQRDQHTFAGHVWEAIDLEGKSWGRFRATEETAVAEISSERTPSGNRSFRPRGETRQGRRAYTKPGWSVETENHQLVLRDASKGEKIPLTDDGSEKASYEFLTWSPDGKTIVGVQTIDGDDIETHLIESSPKERGRAVLKSHVYPLPGDRLTAWRLVLFDAESHESIPCEISPFDFSRPRIRWLSDESFAVEKTERGHQRFRLLKVDTKSGSVKPLIDEQTETFIWTAHTESSSLRRIQWLDKTDELIYASELSGWMHLYLVDANTGEIKNPITNGNWVVRGVDRIDEDSRRIWFSACGKEADEDPYLIHHYRVNFDGTELIALTPGNGTHTVRPSPTGDYFIDSYSRADQPPVHSLRRQSDGALICELERGDADALKQAGWNAPEVFVAKGRDGKTDIWGLIHRPANYDPTKKYPIIESIYAGPHGQHVPKSFSAEPRFQDYHALGFIVVRIDGMGTAFRSKAFHDVCWKNLKDAGFPDRIAWMKAAAAKYPELDISRVGIFGTSAGGQNAASAVLYHPDFYKAAVAACGCHDNRMDKASWNEQWMGYPVGPHYAENSNIDNAHRLGGKLFLIVGELDQNVPPESTLRFADALIKANKDFEMLVIPGMGHSDGGPYGQRRTREFFQRELKP